MAKTTNKGMRFPKPINLLSKAFIIIRYLSKNYVEDAPAKVV